MTAGIRRQRKMEKYFAAESIVGNRRTPKGKREYLVRWAGFGPSADSWEPERNLVVDGLGDFIEKHLAMEALMALLLRACACE